MKIAEEFLPFVEMESVSNTRLPAKSFAAIRLDGKGFSAMTKPLRKDWPFNDDFTNWMLATTMEMVDFVDGCNAAFTGSDEITLIVQDIPENSEKWFGGRMQKIASLAAAKASVAFTRISGIESLFDARVFDVTNDPEVAAKALWARRDSVRMNSVQMLGHFMFGPSVMLNTPLSEVRRMLDEAGKSWNDIPDRDKYGQFVFKERELREVTFTRDGVEQTVMANRAVMKSRPADTPLDPKFLLPSQK